MFVGMVFLVHKAFNDTLHMQICAYTYICVCRVSMGEKKMGRINVNIEDSIESKFRKEVFNQKGMKKGNLTQAIEEAMLLWVEQNEDQDESK